MGQQSVFFFLVSRPTSQVQIQENIGKSVPFIGAMKPGRQLNDSHFKKKKKSHNIFLVDNCC